MIRPHGKRTLTQVTEDVMDAEYAKIDAYIENLKRCGKKVPSDSKGDRPHLIRISAASGVSRRLLVSPRVRRRIKLAVDEIGLEVNRGTDRVRREKHAEQDLELAGRYLLWLEATGNKLPENPTRRGEVFFAQMKLEAGLAPKALCPPGSKTTNAVSAELAKMISAAVVRLGVEVRVLPQAAGYDGAAFTYQVLLNVGTEERRRELDGRPYAGQQLSNTKWALTKFCKTLGLDLTTEVGREFVADFTSSVNIVLSRIDNVSSIRKFQTEIRRWFGWYQQMVRGCAMPDGFRDSFALLVDRFGLPSPLLAKLIGATTDSVRAWYRGVTTPSPESLPAIARMESLCKLPCGLLVSKISQNSLLGRIIPSQLPKRFRSKELRPVVGRVCRHLSPDFLEMSSEKQQEIFDQIRYNVIKCDHPYNLRLTALQRLPYRLRQWPTRLDAEFKELAYFKTAERPPLGMTRNERWRESTKDMVRKDFSLFFGAISLPDDPSADIRLRGLGVPEEDCTLALFACPLVIDWYFRFKFQHRTEYTKMALTLLQRYKALLREGTGWLRQRPDLASRLRPLTWIDHEAPNEGPKELVSQELIGRARTDWDGVCEATISYYNKLMKEITPLVKVARDPFRNIQGIIKMDDPLDSFDIMLEGMKGELPNQHTQPILYHTAIRDCTLVALIAATGFRRNTISLLNHPREGTGHIGLSGECVVLNVPREFFKNPDSSFFGTKDRKSDYYNELPNIYWVFDLFRGYLNDSRPFLLSQCHPGCEDQPLFVTSDGGRDARMSPELISYVYCKMVERYLVRNEYRGTGILNVWPTGPHSARHTRGTAIVRQTGSFRLAGDANQHTEKVAYTFYSEFSTQDRNRLLNETIFSKRIKRAY